MPISITPPSAPQSNGNGDENNLPSDQGQHSLGLPGNKPLPPNPSKPRIDDDELLKGRDLDIEFSELEDDEAEGLKEFIFNEDFLNKNEYETLGALSSEEVIKKDYDKYYLPLEDKVVEIKTWLQEILSDRGKTQDVADARKDRKSEKYKEVKALIDQLLVRHFSQDYVVRNEDAAIVSALVTNEMIGLGPIEPLWQDPRITEIMVNGPSSVRVEINGKLVDVKGVRFRSTEHLLDTCQQILAPLNKTIDIAHPYEDGRLNDGSRINVTHPAIGPGGPYVTIRRFPETVFSMKRLVDFGSMTPEIAVEIGNLIHAGCSTIIAGGTGSGKTSMLNALSGCIPDGERIITIEDNLELRLHPKRHVVALESRRSHQSDRGNVSIRDLVRNALRMRPDRIIVGEVRDGSAYDMLQAMNTGHEGSMTTVHANDAEGAIDRLINLISEVGELDANQAMSLISNGVDIIVAIRRFEDGSRRVESISEIPTHVESKEGRSTLVPQTLWEFVQTGTNPEDDSVVGEYRRVKELSGKMKKKHRLDKKVKLSLEEIYKLSDQAG